MRSMHLFAGAGGGLLADLILGHTPVVAVEWEPYACQVLRERAADGWFPDLRVWEGDVRLFDPSEYTGQVDCIHAGFPCQDISTAGKQAGVGPETRSGLYREVLRIAGVVRPRYLFLENVSAIVANGLDTVLADLTALGYDSEWLCLRASDCGANHHRDRWWLLSHAGHSKSQGRNETTEGLQYPERGNARCEPASLCSDVADTTRELPHRSRRTRNWRGKPANSSCEDMANTNNSGQQQIHKEVERGLPEQFDGGCIQSASNFSNPDNQRQQRRVSDRKPDAEGREEQSNGCVTECDSGRGRIGNGFWSVESSVGRVANGVAHRTHRLKALGNGQVPLQAAVAWKLLGGE